MSRRCAGQASVEAIALVPVMVVALLVVVQLAVLVRGALVVQERARNVAVAASGQGIVTVPVAVRVPSLVPWVGPLMMRTQAQVLTP